MSPRSLIALVACAVAAPSAATAQTYVVDPGVTYTAASVSDAMFASQLVGMTVEVRYSDGTTSGGVWGFLGMGMNGPRYGVQNELFSFSALGDYDTGGPAWSLNDFNLANFNNSGEIIVGLRLHAGPGGGVFDRSFGGLTGTPGSGTGRDARKADDPGDDEFLMAVTYRNAVGVGGAAPVGDLFESVEISFGNGVPEEENYSLFLDTDVAAGLTAVPEPATLLLVGTGLVGVLALHRRRGTRR